MKVQWSNLVKIHPGATRYHPNQTKEERSPLTIPLGKKSQVDFLPKAGKAQDESLDDHGGRQGLHQREAVASRYAKLSFNGSASGSAGHSQNPRQVAESAARTREVGRLTLGQGCRLNKEFRSGFTEVKCKRLRFGKEAGQIYVELVGKCSWWSHCRPVHFCLLS
jgi:hypothetical protein